MRGCLNFFLARVVYVPQKLKLNLWVIFFSKYQHYSEPEIEIEQARLFFLDEKLTTLHASEQESAPKHSCQLQNFEQPK